MTHRIRLPLALCLGLAATGTLAAGTAPSADGPRAERRAALEARFVAADVDRDGRLDRVEAAAVGERFAHRFDRLDKDADGELTREELAAARGARHGRGGHGRAGFFSGLIKGMDDDGDGAIDRTELGTKMPAWSTAFAAIDVNADGKLRRDELRAHARAAARARHEAREEDRG